MDYTQMSELYDDEQLGGEHDQEFDTAIENKLKELHTCLPGIIASYDPTTNTASVQPAIQRVFVKDGPKNLPIIEDVPIVFPSGGPWTATFPVVAGDECVLIFSERALDFWFAQGQIGAPATYRMHNTSDAFAIVGIRNQKRNLANIQTDGLELRNDDRSTYIKLTATGIEIKGNITVTGSITATEEVTAVSGVGEVKLSAHTHPYGGPPPQFTGAPTPGS